MSKGGIIVGREQQRPSGDLAETAVIIPNPNNGIYKLLIKSVPVGAAVKVEVRNMYGMLVYETVSRNKTGTIDVTINTPGLARGLYNVAYIIDGKFYSLKMLVEK